MSLLSNTNFQLGNTTAVPVEVYTDGAATVTVGEFESTASNKFYADYCPDFTGEYSDQYNIVRYLMVLTQIMMLSLGSGTLRNFSFASVRI